MLLCAGAGRGSPLSRGAPSADSVSAIAQCQHKDVSVGCGRRCLRSPTPLKLRRLVPRHRGPFPRPASTSAAYAVEESREGEQRWTVFVANALTEALENYGVEDQDRIVEGHPQMSKKVVWRSADGTLTQGVWEMTEGAIEGFDNNETFVVVEGRATVELNNRGEKFDLLPGVVCVMQKGDPIRITVHEKLRKVYAHRGSLGTSESL
jgi:uncharacterized cupin superfamily protein